MKLTDEQRKILEDIVSVDGKCLSSRRCRLCPMRSKCLPKFLTTFPPSTTSRQRTALDILAHDYLIDVDLKDSVE